MGKSTGCDFGDACACGLHGYMVSLRRSAQSAREGYWVEADSLESAQARALAMSGANTS